jgi:hypothetical protein
MSDQVENQEQPDLPSETPVQSDNLPKWEFKPRKDPKWGEVTKQGLVVGRGANKKVVPPDEVYKLAAFGCTIDEMADWFGVNRDTLKYNFMEYINKGRADVKQRLRNAQMKVALGGNATMLIWLGKNMLGQSDNPNNSEDKQPLPWSEDLND